MICVMTLLSRSFAFIVWQKGYFHLSPLTVGTFIVGCRGASQLGGSLERLFWGFYFILFIFYFFFIFLMLVLLRRTSFLDTF